MRHHDKAQRKYAKEAERMSERLRELREEKKLTPSAAAKEMGIANSTLSGYEDGSSVPTLFAAGQIAAFYDVSLDYLAGRTDTKSPDTSLQGAVEYTGLHEDAAIVLHRATHALRRELASGVDDDADLVIRVFRKASSDVFRDTISRVITHPRFGRFIDHAISARESSFDFAHSEFFSSPLSLEDMRGAFEMVKNLRKQAKGSDAALDVFDLIHAEESLSLEAYRAEKAICEIVGDVCLTGMISEHLEVLSDYIEHAQDELSGGGSIAED